MKSSNRYRKKLTFNEESIEPTDSEFLDVFSKHTKTSWFALMFIMACLPTLCKELVRISTTASQDIEITCLIPHLINKMHWNITSIRNLTMPIRGRVCTYLDYNYSVFENMKPEVAFIAKSRLREPEIKKCTIQTDGGDHSFANYTPTLLNSCSGFQFKSRAKRFRNVSEGLSYIISGFLGDIFGRKTVFIVCAIIFTVGNIITPQAKSYYFLILGYSVEGMGAAGMVILNYIIFVEICKSNIRGLLTLYLTLFGTIAEITGYSIKTHNSRLTETYYLFTIPTCSILFYLYIMPESPRWLLSFGRKRTAWEILERWGEDLSQYVFLPELKLDKCKVISNNFGILFRIRKFKKTIFVMTWFKFVKTTIISNHRRYVKILNNNATSHKFLLLMAEIFSFFSVLPPFILFGRYITLCCMLVAGAICLAISIFTETHEAWYMMNILSAQYLYALEYVIMLYSVELLPTSARGTGLGLILGMGELLAVVGKPVMQTFLLKKVMDYYETYIMLSFQVISIFLIILLPNARIGELPDWKRYRNVIYT